MTTTDTEEAPVIRARFLAHEAGGVRRKWQAASFKRVVTPSLNANEPYVLLIETRTGATRNRPPALVEVETIGLRGGRRWTPITSTELAGGDIPVDARPQPESDES